jgi:hypothetical protein
MAEITLTPKVKQICEWCGRDSDTPLLTVIIIGERGAYRDEICESCAEAYGDDTAA